MLRRVFFIGIIPLMAQEDEQKCFIGCVFALMSIVVYGEAAPFQQPFNNVIAKAHFKKDWQGIAGTCRVRTWFNQAGRKKSRR